MSPAYLLAFRLLPRLVQSDPKRTRQAILHEDLLRKLWIHAGLHLGVSPREKAPQFETFGEVILVTMPEPAEPPEAYFLAMVGEQPELYTLELGEDWENDDRCTFFCGCTKDGHHNYGKGCVPEPGAFLAALAGIR